MNPSKPKTPPKGDGSYYKMMQEAKAKQKKKSRVAISRKKKF